jgi:hypothetical protein
MKYLKKMYCVAWALCSFIRNFSIHITGQRLREQSQFGHKVCLQSAADKFNAIITVHVVQQQKDDLCVHRPVVVGRADTK